MGKIIVPNRKHIFLSRTLFSNLEFFPQFFQGQHFKGTMIFQSRTIYWGKEKVGNS
jgi:hypothetical protein